MKKILFAVAVLLLTAGCAFSSSSQADSAPGVTVANQEGFVLTDKGIDCIVLGMKVTDIPASVSGLYDRVELVDTPDGDEYQFFMGETPVFAADDFGDGKVSLISLFNESPVKIYTTSGADYIEL